MRIQYLCGVTQFEKPNILLFFPSVLSKSFFFAKNIRKMAGWHIRKRIEVVITGLTRNQVAFTGSWVRIPPLPPSKNPVTMRVSGFFLFYAHTKNHPIFSCSFHSFEPILSKRAKKKSRKTLIFRTFWRRVRDSNPRSLSAYSISSAAPSTTRTTLHICYSAFFWKTFRKNWRKEQQNI